LIVFTPKSMLRRKEAASAVADFTTGTFAEMIPDPAVPANTVRRVLMCSGKFYWDLVARRAELEKPGYAIVRLEQLYPLSGDAVAAALTGIPADAEVVWCQEEPANQGPWPHLAGALPGLLGGRPLRAVTRPAAASPATGSRAAHTQEAATLLAEAFE
jgi:2-oxoglutarate dehydrogenase E1 component